MSQPDSYTDTCTCETCGKTYEQFNWEYYSLKYCSDKCRDADVQMSGQVVYYKGSNVKIAEMNSTEFV